MQAVQDGRDWWQNGATYAITTATMAAAAALLRPAKELLRKQDERIQQNAHRYGLPPVFINPPFGEELRPANWFEKCILAGGPCEAAVDPTERRAKKVVS